LKWLPITLGASLALSLATALPPQHIPDPSQIAHGLEIHGSEAAIASPLDHSAALVALKIPPASLALIDHSRLSWARARGGASKRTLYQAPSLPKLVSAVAALRLVGHNDDLTMRRVLDGGSTAAHPATLQGF
jgi:CubicO group peptidase (beta-lactamase class C family)